MKYFEVTIQDFSWIGVGLLFGNPITTNLAHKKYGQFLAVNISEKSLGQNLRGF
ncbi:hypothetical protein BGP_2293 [Beggiatoa sp. PS]|nr:hypothetical protein BGP_2293 [Beggiatoa sp. PS]